MSNWTITPVEAAVLWGASGFDQLPIPLTARINLDYDAVGDLIETTAQRLRKSLTEGQATAVDIIARPTHRIAVIASPTADANRGVRIVSGFRDGHAVIASQNTSPGDANAANGGSITITTTTLSKWITELVSALPLVGAGHLPPVPDLAKDNSEAEGELETVLVDAEGDAVARARHLLVSTRADLLGEFVLEKLDTQTTTVLSHASVLIADLPGDGRYAIHGRTKRSSRPVTPKQLARLVTDEMSDLKNHQKA